MTDYDPLLQRQLRKVGLAPGATPTAEQFRDLLDRVHATYAKAGEDRELLTRSLDLSSAEMADLHREVATQRDQLEQVVMAVSDALSVFGALAGDEGEDLGSALHVAKRRFLGRLAELFDGEASSGWGPGSSSGNTVQAVRRSFLGLADQLASLLGETARSASIRKQLEVARAVQQMLVPERHRFRAGDVSIAALFEPAADCSGDWWTVHPIGDGCVLIVVGDVTGHGIPSAILTGVARAGCDLARRSAPPGPLMPDHVLSCMNHAIYEASRRRFIMTCVAAVIDPTSGTMHLANAGHGFPYLVRDGVLRQLVAFGPPLGSEAVGEYPVVDVSIAPDDLLVWYTDGVVECESPDGDQFSERRFRALCARTAHEGPEAMREVLRAELDAFRGDREATDDVTVVLSRIEPPLAREPESTRI